MNRFTQGLIVCALLAAPPLLFAARAPHRAPVPEPSTTDEQSEADAKAIAALPESARHERTLRAAPEDINEHLDAAEAYVTEAPESSSKLDSAREHVNVVLQSQPRNVRALMLSGRIAILRGQLGQAQASYLTAVGIDPNNAQAYLGLGDVYSRLKDDAKAAAAYAEYRRLTGRKPVPLHGTAGLKDKYQ